MECVALRHINSQGEKERNIACNVVVLVAVAARHFFFIYSYFFIVAKKLCDQLFNIFVVESVHCALCSVHT